MNRFSLSSGARQHNLGFMGMPTSVSGPYAGDSAHEVSTSDDCKAEEQDKGEDQVEDKQQQQQQQQQKQQQQQQKKKKKKK